MPTEKVQAGSIGDTAPEQSPADSSAESTKTNTIQVHEDEYKKINEEAETNKQKLVEASTEVAELKERLKHLESIAKSNVDAMKGLSSDELKKLDDLKYSDPDAWRSQLSALENKKKEELDNKISETAKQAKEAAKQLTAEQTIENFAKETGGKISKDDLKFNVPYKLRKDYDEGKLSLSSFLEGAKKFFGTDKTQKEEKTLGQPNLNAVPGTSKPSAESISKQAEEAYENFVM